METQETIKLSKEWCKQFVKSMFWADSCESQVW